MSAFENPPETMKGLTSMELRDYLRILRKKWLLVTVMTVLGIGAGFVPVMLMPSTYEANTQLYVSVRSDVSTTGDLMQGNSFAREVVSSYADVVATSVVLQPVIDELELDTTVSELAEKVQASTPERSVLIDRRGGRGESQAGSAGSTGTGSGGRRELDQPHHHSAGADRRGPGESARRTASAAGIARRPVRRSRSCHPHRCARHQGPLRSRHQTDHRGSGRRQDPARPDDRQRPSRRAQSSSQFDD